MSHKKEKNKIKEEARDLKEDRDVGGAELVDEKAPRKTLRVA